MATVSFDATLGFFTASAHELNVVRSYWGHLAPDLKSAMVLADGDIPAHDCRECSGWEKRLT